MKDDELFEKFIRYGKFNFTLPYDNSFKDHINPTTDKISLRELEVIYIQYLLECGIFEKSFKFDKWCKTNKVYELFNFMPDYYFFGATNEEGTIKNVHEKVKPFIEKWTFEKVIERWFSLNLDHSMY